MSKDMAVVLTDAENGEITLDPNEEIEINEITYIAGNAGATIVTTEEFLVVLAGGVSACLSDGQSVTVAYPDGDSGYTNAETIVATDSIDIVLEENGDNAVVLEHASGVSIAGVSYDFYYSMSGSYLTLGFGNGNVEIRDVWDYGGELYISGTSGITDILNGIDIPEGVNEVKFHVGSEEDGGTKELTLMSCLMAW